MVQKADSGRDHRWSPRRRLAVPLDDRGVGHAAALTHRLQRYRPPRWSKALSHRRSRDRAPQTAIPSNSTHKCCGPRNIGLRR